MPHAPLPALRAAPPGLHAFILAGGRGTRLLGLTAERAKPAVAFAGNLRLLDFALSNCLNSGLTQVSVLTQYRSDSIEQHLLGNWWDDSGRRVRLEVLQSGRPAGYCGTADAVHQHLDRLRRRGVQQVLVLAADHVCKMDLLALLDTHRAQGTGLTVAALEVPVHEAAGAFGVLQTDASGRVVAFIEKPLHPPALPGRHHLTLASMGIYAADLDLLQALLAVDAGDARSGHDFGHDVLPRAVAEGCLGVHLFEQSCVRGCGAPAYWRDVGSLDSYWRAQLELTRAEPLLDLFDPGWPLRSRPRCQPATHLGPAAAGVSACLVGQACRIEAERVRDSVLSDGVAIGPGSSVESSVLLPGAVRGRRVHLRNAIVDEQCHVPDGIRIGFDAAEDRAHFHVSADGVTLVTAAMLGVGRGGGRPTGRAGGIDRSQADRDGAWRGLLRQ